MSQMSLMVGLPGSGKTGYYNKHLASSHVLVSMDESGTKAKEEEYLINCMISGLKVAVDNTNMTVEGRKRYLELARKYKYPVTCIEVTTDVQTCIARNKLRVGKDKVPNIVIYTANKRYEKPSLEEGFSCVYAVGG